MPLQPVVKYFIDISADSDPIYHSGCGKLPLTRMPTHSSLDRSILEIALDSLVRHKTQLDRMIDSVRLQLTGTSNGAAGQSARIPLTRRKRVISEEARQRMAAGQRRRWAASRKQGKKASVTAAPVSGSTVKPPRKRSVSPEARQRIAEAQRRRWAAVRKSKSA